ncbi:hypothetical protein Ahy_Scaffold1g107074 [Arachis hypogaea]|uniref:Aminotransferase-like plant mobile domain-containing protein n=1 Tax=Arachis hypogaea TaxID=3818 RepID=A0A444WUH5_ARAHY|nr:hypothetical protein Ahy_Scaffold1g107074 [Arachis hypogaea]
MQLSRCIYSIRRQQNMPLHNRIISYLERADLYHLTSRLNMRWFWLDELLVSTFIERWRPETHTFHMPFGNEKYTITLQVMTYQLGLSVDEKAVSGCLTDFDQLMDDGRPVWEWFQELFGELPLPNKVKQFTVYFTWFYERFKMLPTDVTEDTVRIYACVYIMMLLSTQLFGDKSANQVHIWWLPFVARLDELGIYSWGSAMLAWLYRCMCWVTNRNVTNLAGPLQLLQSWIFWQFPTLKPHGFDDFSFPLASRPVGWLRCKLFIVSEPYIALDMFVVVHLKILAEGHSRLWWVVTSLIYFVLNE